ncbi:MAG: outer membrane lipoprotein carrier protein LolA [Salibacteraceae bacterium]
MKTLFSLLALFSISVDMAQDVIESELVPKDPEAGKLLKQLADKHESYTSLKFDFVFKMSNTDGVDETKEGNVLLQGDRYHLKLGEVTVVCNSKTVWMANPATEEVQINDVSTEEDGAFITPTQLLSTYEETFKYRMEGQSQIAGKNVSLVRLYPMQPDSKPFHTLQLAINPNSAELIEMKIFYRDGNVFTYTLSNMETNVPADATQFEYEPPMDWDVSDMREG